jgi:hypothetical protein
VSGHLRPCRSTAGRGGIRRPIASSPRRPGTRRRSSGSIGARGPRHGRPRGGLAMSPSFSGRSVTRSGMPASPSAPAPTPSALLRHPPAGRPPRHPHRARASRAPGRSHHADLHPRPQSRTVGRREPGGSVARPLMAPSPTCARASDIQTSLYRLSETPRILYPGSMYFSWPYRASTATSCSCVLMRESDPTGAPATPRSHPCYVVPQNSSSPHQGSDQAVD